VIQQSNPIRQLSDLIHFIGDEEHGGSLLSPQSTEQLVHLVTAPGIQPRCRLVQHQDLGLHRQHTRQRHATQLATAQRKGPPVNE